MTALTPDLDRAPQIDRRRMSPARRRRLRLTTFAVTTVLAAVCALCIGPFLWLAVSSTHQSNDILTTPPHFWFGSYFIENLRHLQSSIGIGRVAFNSLFLASAYTVLGLIISSLAGYAFAKFRFRGAGLLALLLGLTLVMPQPVTIVPLFKMMLALDWLNTYQGVIAPNLVMPFGIFFMRQSLRSIPDELMLAARIDGAGELRILFQVVLPVMKPALAALSIFMFLAEWNSFIWPLVALRTQNMYTLPLALTSLKGQQLTDYGQLMAGTALSAIPVIVLFLVFQRQFVAGLLAGVTKG